MQVTLETLKEHVPDGIRVAIPELSRYELWTLRAVLNVIQLSAFDELVQAWEIAGDNTDTATEYQKLAQSVQGESDTSESDLKLILEWYYREFIKNKVIT